ncbi:hypothetical protein [Streptomyces sp. NPDC048252]|uniref:hypothetical protein n=1 Tax=Streptomyces sp. NPDC048252 TaxID=3154612 RepID=UPI00341CABAA
MSLIDRLPTRRPRPARKHRAVDELERLRLKLQWADSLIKTQRVQLNDAELKLAASGSRQIELEERLLQQQAAITDLTAERDHLEREVAALKRRFAAQLAADANTHRITVPPMVRDTSAIEDQATGPINVRSLREAAAAGLLGPIHAVTDPGRTH